MGRQGLATEPPAYTAYLAHPAIPAIPAEVRRSVGEGSAGASATPSPSPGTAGQLHPDPRLNPDPKLNPFGRDASVTRSLDTTGESGMLAGREPAAGCHSPACVTPLGQRHGAGPSEGSCGPQSQGGHSQGGAGAPARVAGAGADAAADELAFYFRRFGLDRAAEAVCAGCRVRRGRACACSGDAVV